MINSIVDVDGLRIAGPLSAERQRQREINERIQRMLDTEEEEEDAVARREKR